MIDLDALEKLERTEREATKAPWGFLGSQALCGWHGKRPVILTGNREGGLSERKDNGLLGPVDTCGPNATLLVALRNAAPYLIAAARLAEAIQTGGEWANLTEDGECCSCGATIADEDGELTLPHRGGCPFVAFRAAKEAADAE